MLPFLPYSLQDTTTVWTIVNSLVLGSPPSVVSHWRLHTWGRDGAGTLLPLPLHLCSLYFIISRLHAFYKNNNLRFYFKLKYRLLIQSICLVNKYVNLLIQEEMLRHWRKYSRWNRQIFNNVLLSLRFPKVNLTVKRIQKNPSHSNESVTRHYS